MKKKRKMSETEVKLRRLRKRHKGLRKEKDIQGVLRVKALIAYYKGEKLETIARCYDVSVKSIERWVTNFENENRVSDKPRIGVVVRRS